MLEVRLVVALNVLFIRSRPNLALIASRCLISSSLQSLHAPVLGRFLAFCQPISVGLVAQFDRGLMRAVLALVRVYAFGMSEHFSKVYFAWAYAVAQTALDAGLQT